MTSDPLPLPALLDEVRGCTICAEELPRGPRPVVQISEDARILVAGQAPGRRVHESGIPFDDPSGDRLRDWMGVDRDTFYDPSAVSILPMGFCYPGTGSSGDLPPRPECAPAWRGRLLARMTELRLTLVIGRYALDWHLDAKGSTVTDVVRRWRERWPDVLPLPHPSPRNQRWLKRNPWFEEEVLPASRAPPRRCDSPGTTTFHGPAYDGRGEGCLKLDPLLVRARAAPPRARSRSPGGRPPRPAARLRPAPGSSC